MNVAFKTSDRFVTVDGLNTRYFEEGTFEEGAFRFFLAGRLSCRYL